MLRPPIRFQWSMIRCVFHSGAAGHHRTAWRAILGATLMAGLAGTLNAQEVIRLPGDDRWLEANFEEVYRIGSLAGEEWEQFGTIHGVAFDGTGRLFVFDPQIARIFVVRSDGVLIRKIGRRGEGPGEFRSAEEMVVMDDGRIAVLDAGHRAYHVFDANGDFVRMVRMGGDRSFAVVSPHLPQRGATAAITAATGAGGSTFTMVYSDEAPRGRRVPSRPIEHIDLSGQEAVKSVVIPAWLPRLREAGERERGHSLQHEFAPGLHWGVLPDGSVAFSDSTAYRVRIAARGSGISHILVRPFNPEPVTDRLISRERNRRLRELEGTPNDQLRNIYVSGQLASPEVNREVRRKWIEEMSFFDEVAVIRGLRASWNGSIWVQRRGEEPADDDGPLDVLDSGGRYLGSYPPGATAMPDAFGPNGLAAFLEADEYGVTMVVVRRLPTTVN